MKQRQITKMTFGVFIIIAVISLSAANAQEYCTPQDGVYPPEADVTLTIGSPCDSMSTLAVPVYLDNPCPVGGFQMNIVLTDTNHGVYFDPSNPNVADTAGSRISGFGYFNFNVLNSSTITLSAIGPGGQDPELPPGSGLIFTLHPSYTGIVDDCQTVRFGAIDYVYDPSGYYSYGASHVNGYLCVGCDPAWRRGDANRSGTLNVVDVTALFSHLKGVTRICIGNCICTADFNSDGLVNIADVTQMFAFLKGSGNPPLPCD